MKYQVEIESYSVIVKYDKKYIKKKKKKSFKSLFMKLFKKSKN